MRNRLLRIVIRLLAALIELAALVGAVFVQNLTSERMMVMRYFVAKNRILEQFWFSPTSLNVQRWLMVAVTIALLAAVVLAARRKARVILFEAILGLLAAMAGTWLVWTMTTSEMLALYAMIAALWIVVLFQSVFTAVGLREH